MVLLSRIYTKTGDKGKTSLGDGTRVYKHTLRIKTMGMVDSTNATVGLATLQTQNSEALALLKRIQNDLFDIGADLCMPVVPKNQTALRITTAHIERLEQEIDTMNAELQPLNSFVLPGGTAISTYLHLARTSARLSEGMFHELVLSEEAVNPLVGVYLNRLSDHLFVMARSMNNKGQDDVLWQPGLNLETPKTTS